MYLRMLGFLLIGELKKKRLWSERYTEKIT
jgi:hypothetical protein